MNYNYNLCGQVRKFLIVLASYLDYLLTTDIVRVHANLHFSSKPWSFAKEKNKYHANNEKFVVCKRLSSLKLEFFLERLFWIDTKL